MSHVQHLEVTRAYFDHLERATTQSDDPKLQQRRASNVVQPLVSNKMAPVEPADLRAQLELVQQKQQKEELAQLQAELDQVTDEANRRIERGNESIIKLKDQLKKYRDVE